MSRERSTSEKQRRGKQSKGKCDLYRDFRAGVKDLNFRFTGGLKSNACLSSRLLRLCSTQNEESDDSHCGDLGSSSRKGEMDCRGVSVRASSDRRRYWRLSLASPTCSPCFRLCPTHEEEGGYHGDPGAGSSSRKGEMDCRERVAERPRCGLLVRCLASRLVDRLLSLPNSRGGGRLSWRSWCGLIKPQGRDGLSRRVAERPRSCPCPTREEGDCLLSLPNS